MAAVGAEIVDTGMRKVEIDSVQMREEKSESWLEKMLVQVDLLLYCIRCSFR
jgi:hypothetical protein